MNDEDEGLFILELALNEEQMKCFYSTMETSLRNWPGGDPGQQIILQILKDKAFMALLELQFQKG